MAEGYQIIETESTDYLARINLSGYFQIAVFYWLLKKIKLELKEQLGSKKIGIILVEYISTYPAIGIKHVDFPAEDNVSHIIENMFKKMINSYSVNDFLNFVLFTKNDWRSISESLINDKWVEIE